MTDVTPKHLRDQMVLCPLIRIFFFHPTLSKQILCLVYNIHFGWSSYFKFPLQAQTHFFCVSGLKIFHLTKSWEQEKDKNKSWFVPLWKSLILCSKRVSCLRYLPVPDVSVRGLIPPNEPNCSIASCRIWREENEGIFFLTLSCKTICTLNFGTDSFSNAPNSVNTWVILCPQTVSFH